jgi:hypothetical protein
MRALHRVRESLVQDKENNQSDACFSAGIWH